MIGRFGLRARHQAVVAFLCDIAEGGGLAFVMVESVFDTGITRQYSSVLRIRRWLDLVWLASRRYRLWRWSRLVLRAPLCAPSVIAC
jgi:hypothetical protein